VQATWRAAVHHHQGRFEKAHPTYTLDLLLAENEIEKLLTLIAAGTPPDVYWNRVRTSQVVIRRDAAADLQPLMKRLPQQSPILLSWRPSWDRGTAGVTGVQPGGRWPQKRAARRKIAPGRTAPPRRVPRPGLSGASAGPPELEHASRPDVSGALRFASPLTLTFCLPG
jgi:hypothetical protein